jgi:acylglycerol lipase
LGFFIFALALLWPPLILLCAYMASKLIPYSFRINDDASKRRQLFAEFSLDEDLPENFRQVPPHIHAQESYWINARGMALCTVTMIPKDQPIKAVVCFCHGYTDSASYMKKIEFQRLVNKGIAFCAIEYEGHGRSDGPLALISNWDRMIGDVASYFQEVVDERFKDKPVFLMGESMG